MTASITVYGVKIGTRLADIEADFAGKVQVLTGKLLADTLSSLNADSVGIMLDVSQFPDGDIGAGIVKSGFDYLAQCINEQSQLFVTATGNKVFHVSMINFNYGGYAVNYPAIVDAAKASATYAGVMAWPQPDATADENIDLTGTAPLVIGDIDLGVGLDMKRVTLTAQTDSAEDGGYIYTVTYDEEEEEYVYTLTAVNRNAAALFATGITNETTEIAYETVSNLINYLQHVITTP